jgi:galactose-1-phosphate uridylyltransferase
VIGAWTEQTEELVCASVWAQVLENKGELTGTSNPYPYPYGQIWASANVPTLPAVEAQRQAAYQAYRSPPLVDCAAEEDRLAKRVVVLTLLAAWPYVTPLILRRPTVRLPELPPPKHDPLVRLLKRLVVG